MSCHFLFSISQATIVSELLDCSISLPIGFLTDVVFNEGDAMMLDVSLQGATDGSANIATITLA